MSDKSSKNKTLNVDPETHKKLKVKAAQKGKTLKQLLAELVNG